MKQQKLPIGIQDFRTIRQDNCYYVDKTPLIRQLVEQGRYFFLSRPRRFGKSLLIDTLWELFEGNEELFRGLDIYEHWDWSIKHPVVRISFDAKYNDPEDLEGDIIAQLEGIESDFGLEPGDSFRTGPTRLRNLLRMLHKVSGQRVVVLVDEYDKPILDVLDNPELAEINRDYLRGLYGVVKGSARNVRFVLVTGISMFSKVSLFSGLNNLTDISLDPRYATICGYTETDLDTVFASEIKGFDRELIRKWYNGYNWRGSAKVYNPFDVLLLFSNREFQSWWFKTGTPTFLFQRLIDRRINPIALANRVVDEKLVSKFDIEDIGVEALLLQTGYLTIVDESWDGVKTYFTLDYPNFEVSTSFNDGLLDYVTRQNGLASEKAKELAKLLRTNDFDGFAKELQAYLSGIPHQWYDQSQIARYESHYASMLYMAFLANGLELRAEDSASHGRADLVVFHADQIFVLEFKMVEDDCDTDKMLDEAMLQMRERGYAEKYKSRNEPIHLLGMVFGREQRNLLGIRVGSS